MNIKHNSTSHYILQLKFFNQFIFNSRNVFGKIEHFKN